MRPVQLLSSALRCAAVLGVLAAALLRADEPAPPAKADRTGSMWDLPDFVAHLPDLLAERLPGFDPEGAVRLYVRPHFGDFLHRDYLRVPVGARMKVSELLESSVELQSYFSHGLGDHAGNGLSGLQLGAKCEHMFPGLPGLDNGGISFGANFLTPLSRPPRDLTDGHRHFQPYVAASRPLVRAWRVLGYATIAGDFLNHTALPANFGRNQLHANSLMFSMGAAREWPWFHASLTGSVTTSRFTSDEAQQVYALRPEVVVPWKPASHSSGQILFTLGGRAIHGPDGNEYGMSGSVRVEFALNRRGK